MLPNPFSANAFPKLNSSTNVSSVSVSLNPGPGLPQAAIATYEKYVPPPQSTYNQRGRGGGYMSSGPRQQFLPFSCDRCDRSFKSKEVLDLHISEHIPCGINGCKFVAHPKIVEKHIQMQHETGLAEKIMALNSPEEIEKWKEERRKNFPSKDNVARRQAEQKEKLDRGEVLYEPKKRFGRGGNQQGRGRGNNRGGRGGRGGQGRNPRADGEPNGEPKKQDFASYLPAPKPTPVPLPPSIPKVKEVKALSDGELESDDEAEAVPLSGSNALTSLMGSYQSSDSEQDTPPVLASTEKPDVKKEEETKEKQKRNRKKRPNKRKGKDSQHPSAPAAKQFIRPKRLTLLQKLLQGEILHERNVILQCVYYIVQEKFFGIGESGSSSDSQTNEIKIESESVQIENASDEMICEQH